MNSRTLAIVAALGAAACTDNPNASPMGPIDRSQPILPSPSTTTIAGRITVTGTGSDLVITLRDGFDAEYLLVGNKSIPLGSLDGGDVIVRGTFDANPGLVVQDFVVTAMRGRSALDGVLEATDDGFALRLVDGSLKPVPGLTADCAEHVGSRLWVIGWEDGDVEFGLIPAS